MARVCHLLGHLRFGAGRVVVDLATCQRRHGAVVDVLVSENAEFPWQNDNTLVEELLERDVTCKIVGDTFHRRPASLAEAAATLARHVGDWRQVVCHAHSAMAAVVAAWAGAPTIVATCHGWNPERPPSYELQDALALRWPGLVVTSPSRAWAEAVTALTGLAVEVVPLGLDLRRFPEPEGDADAPPRIVTVCELSARKGLDIAFEAMSRLWSTHPAVEWHLYGDGEMLGEARRFAAAANVPSHDRCVVHGPVPHACRQLRRSDVFCLPSRSDNLPVAIIEALLACVPVVATEVGGGPELAVASRAISLVPANDAPALTAALRCVLDMTPGARRALGDEGGRYARWRFDVERVWGQYDDVYGRARARA